VEALYTILWGLTSIATVLVKTATSFYLLRFLLGAFEAGLLPGAALGTHDHRRVRRSEQSGHWLAVRRA